LTRLIAGGKWDEGVIVGLARCVRREFAARYGRYMEYFAIM
jgi:hypothetical protein